MVEVRRLRYAEAAKYLGLPKGTLASLVCRKQIPHVRISKRLVLFETDALDAWIAERRVGVK